MGSISLQSIPEAGSRGNVSSPVEWGYFLRIQTSLEKEITDHMSQTRRWKFIFIDTMLATQMQQCVERLTQWQNVSNSNARMCRKSYTAGLSGIHPRQQGWSRPGKSASASVRPSARRRARHHAWRVRWPCADAGGPPRCRVLCRRAHSPVWGCPQFSPRPCAGPCRRPVASLLGQHPVTDDVCLTLWQTPVCPHQQCERLLEASPPCRHLRFSTFLKK